MHSHQHGINIEALLAHVPLFSGLETDEIARLARGSRELTASRGDILFHKGDMPTGFYLIVYGQVKLAFTSAQGGEKVVDIVGQGQTFGEAVMFMDKPCHGLCAGTRRFAPAAHLEGRDGRRTQR
jgi:CRP-like cAMP-binding protein